MNSTEAPEKRGPYIVNRTNHGDGTVDISVEPNTAELADLSIVDYTSDGIPIVGIRSPEELAKVGGVPDGYKLEWYRPNTWPIQTRDETFGGSAKEAKVVIARQARGTFSAPSSAWVGASELLAELRKRGPKRRPYKYKVIDNPNKHNMLELSIPDLHLGMHVWEREGESEYNFEIAERLFLTAIEELIKLSKPFGFEKILLPIGNDFMHVDGRDQSTTHGTHQGEAAEWRYTFTRGRDLLISAIDRLKKLAPVHVISIPGNHDHDTSISMSYVIQAYYHNDPNVEVEAGPESIRYVRYGDNLIGFEHGRNISPARLAGLMAEDNPEDWAATRHRAWHLGDQHRKGGAWFSELGVEIDYIPSLASVNSWHRWMSYTWRRAAYAYVWNKTRGPISRLHIHVDPRHPELLLGEIKD